MTHSMRILVGFLFWLHSPRWTVGYLAGNPVFTDDPQFLRRFKRNADQSFNQITVARYGTAQIKPFAISLESNASNAVKTNNRNLLGLLPGSTGSISSPSGYGSQKDLRFGSYGSDKPSPSGYGNQKELTGGSYGYGKPSSGYYGKYEKTKITNYDIYLGLERNTTDYYRIYFLVYEFLYSVFQDPNIHARFLIAIRDTNSDTAKIFLKLTDDQSEKSVFGALSKYKTDAPGLVVDADTYDPPYNPSATDHVGILCFGKGSQRVFVRTTIVLLRNIDEIVSDQTYLEVLLDKKYELLTGVTGEDLAKCVNETCPTEKPIIMEKPLLQVEVDEIKRKLELERLARLTTSTTEPTTVAETTTQGPTPPPRCPETTLILTFDQSVRAKQGMLWPRLDTDAIIPAALMSEEECRDKCKNTPACMRGIYHRTIHVCRLTIFEPETNLWVKGYCNQTAHQPSIACEEGECLGFEKICGTCGFGPQAGHARIAYQVLCLNEAADETEYCAKANEGDTPEVPEEFNKQIKTEIFDPSTNRWNPPSIPNERPRPEVLF